MPALARLFRLPRAPSAAERIAGFLRLPEHHWIAADRRLLDRIAGFLCLIPASDLAVILGERRLLLLYCNQRMSCAFYQYRSREIVLVFPELRRLLLSPEFPQGYAVLAHELGHVLHGHANREIHPLLAQLEADRYAAELGFAAELRRVLLAEEEGPEVRERLSALTR